MTGKRRIKAEDLYNLKSVTDPQLAANGKDCLFVETVMLEKENTYAANLYYLDIENKTKPVQWTFGEHRNHSPRWSPNGEIIAFVSNRTGKNQIYVMNRGGGEAKQVTHCLSGALNPVWSPDGLRIAFNTALKEDGDLLLEEKGEEKKEKKLEPLEVDKMKYKSDDSGFWDGKYTHIAIVHIDTEEIKLLTSGEHDYKLQSWSPNGEKIALTANLSEEKDFSFINDVYLLDVTSKEVQNITNGTGVFGDVTWSPDGNYLGMFGHEREYENATLTKLWLYQFSSQQLSSVTADSNLLVGDYAIGDFQQGKVTPGLLWGEDNNSFYFLATDHGNTVVYYGTIAGELYPALLENQHVYGLSTGGKVEKAVVAISTSTNPGDLFLLTVSTGELTQLTNVNEPFFKETAVAIAEPIHFKSSDDWDLHGWMMKPVNYEEGKKYPLVVEIHGGPHMMFANSYFHEFQCLAAQEFAVLFINPRGSLGYGQAFVDAVRGDYGGKDYEDIMDAVDYALANYPFIDENRLGVTGGSYGGFMTNWIVGHTNRFKAAVTQRSISNWTSFFGVSDIGYYFTEWQIKSHLGDIETLWKHSPLAYVEKIETPLLILHSEKDYRCPIEQAEQLFIALKYHKKTTKFIRFPESNHELSRSGKPNLRIKRLHYITDWFIDYLN